MVLPETVKMEAGFDSPWARHLLAGMNEGHPLLAQDVAGRHQDADTGGRTFRAGRVARPDSRYWPKAAPAAGLGGVPIALPCVAGASRSAAARLLLAILLSAVSGCVRDTPVPPDSLQWLSMGTGAAVSAPAGQAARVQRMRETVAATFDEIERDLSSYRPDSLLSAVNAAAGEPDPVPVNATVATVIRLAIEAAEAGDGAFDPTVGPLMALWGFRDGTVTNAPVAAAIAETLHQIGWRHIRLDLSDPEAPTVRLAKPGMRLDLGGIAKGYAVDLAYDRLRAAGETDFMINLGGNLRVHGVPGAGRDGWRIGVRDPFHRDGILDTVTLHDGDATATSGNYERFVVLGGVRYAHIIDPRSGRPVTGVAGVTVIAPTAVRADALSTTCFVLGPDDGLRLLDAFPGCQALWVPDEQPVRIRVSAGFFR